jgi:GNAT superfamily N-acetyltransferase
MSDIYHVNPIRRIFSTAAARCGVRFFNSYYCERDLREPLPAPRLDSSYRIRRATSSDLATLVALREGDERLVFEGAQRLGTCYVAYAGDEIAGYSFVRSEVMHIYWRRPLECFDLMSLPPHVCYTHNCYVLPAFRGHGIYQDLLRFQYQDRLEAGFQYACNLIPKTNLYSLNAHRKVGNRMHHRPILKLPSIGPRFMGLGSTASWDALRPVSWRASTSS